MWSVKNDCKNPANTGSNENIIIRLNRRNNFCAQTIIIMATNVPKTPVINKPEITVEFQSKVFSI